MNLKHDNTSNNGRAPLPYDKTSFFSKWTYSWISALLRLCRQVTLTTSNLYTCPSWLSTLTTASNFEGVWLAKEHRSYGWVYLVITFAGWWFWWSGLLALGADLLQSQGANLMRSLIVQLKSNQSVWATYTTGALLVAASFGRKVLLNQSLFIVSTIAYMVRAGSMGASYSKILHAKQHWAIGSGLNRLSVDSNRVCTMILFSHVVWSCPLRISLAFRTTYLLLGTPALFGIGFVMLVLGSLFWLAREMHKARRKLATISDERLQLTNEAFHSIRTIKSLNLQSLWIERIEHLRYTELCKIRALNTQFAIAASLNFWSPVMATTIAIVATILMGQKLEESRVFPAARAFQSLMVPLWLLPNLVNRAISASVSAQRIDQILRSEAETEKQNATMEEGLMIELKGASFSLKDREIIHNVSLKITRPGVYAITGPTASGKSTLLAGLARVIMPSDGEYRLNCTSVGYCPFPGWIRNGTIRDNIVFDRPFDQTELERVMKACALHGELSPEKIVGEAGCAISGGQRQRISLARALYGKPPLLLADDLLSSLDVKIASHIWNECFLNNDNIPVRIIVTNDERLMGQCNSVISLEDGGIVNFASWTVQYDQPCVATEESVPPEPPLDSDNGCDVYQDSLQTVSSKYSIKRFVLAAGGPLMLILLFFCVLGTDVSKLGRDKYLKARFDPQVSSNPSATRTFLLFFVAWGSLQGILTAVSNILAMYLCYRASKVIHGDALRKMINAKMSFLESTATGKLLNRLGRDLEILDYNLPEKLIALMGCFSTIICTVLAIAQIVPLLLITFLLPLLWVYALQTKFSRLWRALLRLNGMAMTPMIGLLAETVTGMSTIRAFQQISANIERFFTYLDDYTVSSFLSIAARRWISLRSEFGVSLYLAGSIFYCIYYKIDSANVGMLLMYALEGTESIDWLIKHLAEIDQFMVSIERIAFYSDSLPLEHEGAKHAEMETITETAPARIQFENISIYYRGISAVANISFTVEKGEKTVIIGRTGAGKSSLISALVRLVDHEGTIRIDDSDINSIPLNELRQRITTVLQEPALFDTSIRDNIDPYSRHLDSDLWTAMELTGLAPFIRSSPNLLDTTPKSFSTGQKQLVCLTRALLLSPKVLLLDEATSALDAMTEIEIHRLITGLSATIITVTHRLDIVQYYDRVITMEAGQIVEVGNPSVLLADPSSKYSRLHQIK